MNTSKAQEIVNYYDECQTDYERFWHLKESLALHAGFWDSQTKNLKSALQNENKVLAQMAQITSDDIILDAGCGVGGSAIYLAQHLGCQVKGISLSERQIDQAKQNAKSFKCDHLTSFDVMDYTSTRFEDQSFDVIWAIESVCHATDKKAFLKEAFRLLKPQGRLIVADGFKFDKPDPHAYMQNWLQGWGVGDLALQKTFYEELKDTGFEKIAFRNFTKEVMPSSKRLFMISLPAYIFSKAGEWIGMRTKRQTNNILSAYYQYKTLKASYWCYGVFTAVKH